MTDYNYIDVAESQLEDLIRNYSNKIEDGLQYLDHQKLTPRGPLDVLFVDSGNSLIVAELKIIEDDSMLMQAIDYYDFVSKNIDSIARQYKDKNIDPKQDLRIILIAPSFSINLINRCKWIDINISLFTYRCIVVNDSKDIMPIFNAVNIPSTPETIQVYNINDRINYIRNKEMKKVFDDSIKEIQSWDKNKILIEPTKYDISLKISGRVFGYLCPRRDFFIINTYNPDNKWTPYPINQIIELEEIKKLLKANIDRLG